MFFKKNDNQWPLSPQYTLVDECTGNYEDCACVYLPLSVLRHGAQSFSDWPSTPIEGTDRVTPWQLVMITFGAIVQRAFMAGIGSRKEALCEMVCGETPDNGDEPPVLGYRFVLMYSKSTGLNRPQGDGVHGAGAGSGGAARPGGSGGLGGGGSDSDSSSDDDSDDEDGLDGVDDLADRSGPKTLNEIIASILTYQRRQRLATMSPKRSVAQAAQRELTMIERGSLGYSSWKSIKSADEWHDIVSSTLGRHFHGSDMVYQACENVFNITTAFRERHACAEQSMSRLSRIRDTGADVPYYVITSGAQWNLRWPNRERVYRIPPDVAIMGAAGLFSYLMMHQQVRKMRAVNHLSILLPELVRKHEDDQHQAGEDADGDAHMESDILEAEGTAEVDGEERDIYLMSALFEKLSAAPPTQITRVENPMALSRSISHKRKALEFGVAEGGSEKVHERRMSATAYHSIQRAVDRTIGMIASNYGSANPLAARKMLILARYVALNVYHGIGTGTQGVAPKMRILMKRADEENLRHVPADLRSWFRFVRPGHKELERLTMLSAYKRKFRKDMEIVFRVNHLHHLCEVTEWFSLDAYRYSADLHCNFCAISKKGGTGKSNLWYILGKLRIDGTWDKLTYTTGAGFTGTEDESPNMNDDIKCYDEISPSMFAPGEKNANDHESRLKSILSNCEVMVEMTIVDTDNGSRRKVSTWVQTIMTVFCSTNIDQGQIQHAMRRRFYCAGIPEEPTGRLLIDAMAQADLDPIEMKSLGGKVRAIFHRKQVHFAEIEKLIHSGALPDVSMDLCGLLDMAIFPLLRRNTGFVDPSPSAIERRNQMARKHAIYRGILHCFYAPDFSTTHPGWRREKFLPTHVTADALATHLPQRLFVSVEDYCGAMGMLAEEIVNPLDHAVSRGLVMLYEKRRDDKDQIYEDLFQKRKQTRTNTGVPSGQEEVTTRDFNYVVFDFETLVTDLIVLLPQIMHGFTTNSGAIRRALLNLTDRRFRSYPYVAKNALADPTDPSSWMIMVEEDRKQSQQFYSCARVMHSGRTFVVHTDFVARGNNKTYDDATSTIAAALQDVLGVQGQLERDIVLGSHQDKPDDPFMLHLRPRPGSDVFKVKKTSVLTNKDFETVPEIEETVPNAREVFGREYLTVECDLDTHAMQEHFKRNYVTGARISPAFLDILHGTDGALENLEPVLAGEPTRFLIEDSYQRWVKQNLGRIHREFARPATPEESDVDFDPREFMVRGPNDELVSLEDELPRFFPNPKVFDVQSYDDLDFKLIAHHPLVEDAYLKLLGV